MLEDLSKLTRQEKEDFIRKSLADRAENSSPLPDEKFLEEVIDNIVNMTGRSQYEVKIDLFAAVMKYYFKLGDPVAVSFVSAIDDTLVALTVERKATEQK